MYQYVYIELSVSGFNVTIMNNYNHKKIGGVQIG